MSLFKDIFTSLENKNLIKILFVCSGNICRSAYADFFFRRLLSETEDLKNKFEIKSGALSFKNSSIDPRTVKSLMSEGFSKDVLNSHIPRIVNEHEYLLEEADLIIGFTSGHRLNTPKEFRNKFQMLSQLVVSKKIDIGDPYFTESFEEFKLIVDRIKEFLIEFLDLLKNHFTPI